ncbi:sensor histidine kinase [Amorphoplanes digitatis]|uniref:histidine kinase n=1 Tax=Actinoplanes digitatis TaxID=1868 RepID=A0A7W7I1K8_9ACTN|nr:sensor histidine kinase [Actinoplanes digitatis]MBB4764724.1 signal transduction histidine kinase [Actinoplanes digitatis]GID91323.1 histidine kinase [Actinoplanes digitatis]
MIALRAPFTTSALRQAVFCVAGVAGAAAVLAVPAIIPALGVLILWATGALSREPAPAVAPLFLVLFPLTVALLVVLAAPAGRALGAAQRRLADRLLGVRVDAPPPRPSRRIGAVVSDGPGWRALGYGLLKVPLAIPEGYGAFCYVFGLVNLTYPVWWPLFRNHPPGTRLDPVLALTPFGTIGARTFAGTLLIAAAGLAMLLVAPWLMRAGTALDLAAMRRLLGPRRLAERVRELQITRARAIDDAATMMRRLERDLHDGAQIRLATLAMNLGMAIEKLGADGPPPDLAQARELVALAHRGAKDALADLRDLVRGIHPPVLDNGIGDALATLATGSAIPVAVDVELPDRPAPAIETIAYFCAAELLANAAKHSRATRIGLGVVRSGEHLRLTADDDGVGGADPDGPGLSGLARRIAVVDGRMRVHSPAGGPTRVEIDLPTHA